MGMTGVGVGWVFSDEVPSALSEHMRTSRRAKASMVKSIGHVQAAARNDVVRVGWPPETETGGLGRCVIYGTMLAGV